MGLFSIAQSFRLRARQAIVGEENERSQKLTGKSIVVTIRQIIIDEDRDCAVFIVQALLDNRDFRFGNLQTRPTIPLEGGGLGQSTEATHQSTGGHGEVIFPIFGALDSDRQAIGDEQQTCVILGFIQGRHGSGELAE